VLDFVGWGPADWAVESASLGILFLMTIFHTAKAERVPTGEECFVHYGLGFWADGALIRVKFPPLVLWLSHLVSKRN